MSDDLIYVPGDYYCTVCNCRVHKRTIDKQTGNVGVSPFSENEMCPNGCKAMSRVTWKQEAMECREALMRMYPTGTNAA